ncbi:MAG: glycoside hydrolase family 38 C-terminal domain-containing protein, partial [Phycisphaerales bacterium]|nr:glycoside hydrolase family 38 C-terminal domain-containing protein [Phycisphaerales bacterium]
MQLRPYRAAQIGQQFGPLWATYWFHVRTRIPSSFAGRQVELHWISHSEATLWMDGKTVQGLNYDPKSWDGAVRSDAVLLRKARGGESLEFWIEMACNGMFGDPGGRGPYSSRAVSPFVLEACELRVLDPLAWEMYHDFSVLVDLEAEHDRNLDPCFAGELLSTLNQFANCYIEEDRASWRAAHAILKSLYQRKNATSTHQISAVGHAHIDTAWLWPLAETWRKCERTFSSQTRYMDDYPEYKFACSQAYQYDMIRRRNPDLYRRIRERVARGQWLPVGGTWVEPDCNIPSGESLVRQFLHGQRFFQQQFGRRCREFWNPDVFGYNGQLPQIMRGAGVTRFLTQKLSWNRFTKPPHHTFRWQGIDGSEVVAHFPPADTYNGNCTVREIRHSVHNYKDHDRSRHSYYLFGYGDGGGGPTRHMIESLRRMGDTQGLPRVTIRSSDDFFRLLETDCTDMPTIVGELYFELHRGTYTSQAAVKRGNRKCEILLHDGEFLCAINARLSGPQASDVDAYPKAEFDDLWKTALLNQFHDILPGSSIAEVYVDATADHRRVQTAAASLRDRAIRLLARKLRRRSAGSTPLNTIGFDRLEVMADQRGQLACASAGPYGFGKWVEPSDRVSISEESGGWTIENAALRARVSRSGAVSSLIEKTTGRESLAGEGNVFELFDDHPTAWDAWDIDPFHLETARSCGPARSAKVVRRSPLRTEIRFEHLVGRRSRLAQTIRLDAHARKLEIHCRVDWRESHRLLKVAWPVNVRAMNATYEMQFGSVERPTHFNTPGDLAKFEVPLHRWMDLSEHGFGVAILNDCKYGGSVLGNTMRLSLLRAPASPDPSADRGVHEFAYAVYPHAGGWRDAGVTAEGYRFNHPLLLAPGEIPAGSLFWVDSPDLVLDTVKQAEDSGDLIIRIYEC